MLYFQLSQKTVPPESRLLVKSKRVSTVKSLGVHIDENLTWECHINELSKKIASGISAIKRIRYSVTFHLQFISSTSSRLLQFGVGILF